MAPHKAGPTRNLPEYGAGVSVDHVAWKLCLRPMPGNRLPPFRTGLCAAPAIPPLNDRECLAAPAL